MNSDEFGKKLDEIEAKGKPYDRAIRAFIGKYPNWCVFFAFTLAMFLGWLIWG